MLTRSSFLTILLRMTGIYINTFLNGLPQRVGNFQFGPTARSGSVVTTARHAPEPGAVFLEQLGKEENFSVILPFIGSSSNGWGLVKEAATLRSLREAPFRAQESIVFYCV